MMLPSLSVRELIMELADTETVLAHGLRSAANAELTDPVLAKTRARQAAILAELHERCSGAAPASAASVPADLEDDSERPLTTSETEGRPAPQMACDVLKELERFRSYLGSQCFPADREELLRHGVRHHVPPALLQLLIALPEHRIWPDLAAALRDLSAAAGEWEHR